MNIATYLQQSWNDHPAFRALAVTGNNLACTLEEKNHRSLQETELMILASRTARKYWELAGGWLEISRAEYRLAMNYLQAKAHYENMNADDKSWCECSIIIA